MVDHLCAAIGKSRSVIMAEYDARTDEALSRLASTLPPPQPLSSSTSLMRPMRKVTFCGKTCSRALSQPCRTSLAPLLVTPGASRQMRAMETRNRTKVQDIITACIDSGVREGLLQMHEGEGSWAARSTPVTARPWILTSTSTRSASVWAVLDPQNRSPAPPATQASWTRAPRMPPAAPWRGHARSQCRLLSHPRGRTTMRPHL